MRLFGFEIVRTNTKALPALAVGDRGRWWFPIVREPFTGAWQRNMEERAESLLAYHAVYACVTLIASDVAKCRIKLVQKTDEGIWIEIENAAHSPVLRKPNDYQSRIQFIEHWLLSKLIFGNTYALKARDARGVVQRLYVLDPLRTRPLVAEDGSVFYDLTRDLLSGVEANSIRVPASEIIHDMCTMRYHPLCGVPPMAPAALAATHGIQIQRGATALFSNGSRPGGILTAPGRISEENAKRIKELWEQNYSGANVGRVAVLGDDLQYHPVAQTAAETQLIEQLGVSAKMVCSSFQVPPYMVGVGEMPAYNNIEALTQQYYSQCLQKHFEAIELGLDEGLGLTNIDGKTYGVEFDLDDLLRMDTATRIKTYSDAVRGGLFKPNEARAKFDLEAVEGGDEVYLQQQNFSLAALAKRDAKEDPFSTAAPAPAPAPANGNGENGEDQSNEDNNSEGDVEEAAATAQLAAWELKKQLDLLAA